jgi:hypothetical protein
MKATMRYDHRIGFYYFLIRLIRVSVVLIK